MINIVLWTSFNKLFFIFEYLFLEQYFIKRVESLLKVYSIKTRVIQKL
jgi:hypothetical protein